MKRNFHLVLFSLVCFVSLEAQVHEQGRRANIPILQEALLKNTAQHASWQGYPSNGSLQHQLNNKPLFSTATRNHKLHGDWQSWYQNGLLCDSGRFVNGLPDGLWKYWNKKGELIAIRTYSADKY